MQDLTAKINLINQQTLSEYDKLIRLIAENQIGELELQGTFELPAVAGNGLAQLALPELPEGGKWIIAAVGDAQAKAVTTGSAGQLDLTLENAAGDIVASISVANTDVDDTFINAQSVDSTPIPGGEVLLVDVTALATAGAGPVTLRLKLAMQKILLNAVTDLQ